MDMADIPRPKRGAPDPVEYAELAVATRSPLLLIGIGTGPTMLARRIPSIMPVPPGYEHLRASVVPFRSPHDSISPRAMARGPASAGYLGEAQLSRGGVLYLADVDEFNWNAEMREAIRQQAMSPDGRGSGPYQTPPKAPALIVGSIDARPLGNQKLTDRIRVLEKRAIPFPLKLTMEAITLADMGGGPEDLSTKNPRSSAAILERISQYDPAACQIAHDLVEEGQIEKAWEILRGGQVEHRRHRNPPTRRDNRAAIAEFQKLIRGDRQSLAIAQDVLLENELTLAEASFIGQSTTGEGAEHSAWGRFEAAGTSGASDYEAADWRVEPVNGKFRVRLDVFYDGGMFPMPIRMRGAITFDNRQEAIHDVVECAWTCIKVMKRLGGYVGPNESVVDLMMWAINHQEDGHNKAGATDGPRTQDSLISLWGKGNELRAQLAEQRRANPDNGGSMPSSKALRMYVGFHQHEPKHVGSLASSLKIPATATLIGDAVHVLYKSDKLNPTTGIDEGWIDYIHEHESGVKVYRCDARGRSQGVERAVPQWLQNADDLVWLGQCKGFAYEDGEGQHEVKGTRPYPDLFCTKNGKALLVIQSKRTLLAMIWGGRLGVEPRGIVH